jgi:hypothetical protein
VLRATLRVEGLGRMLLFPSQHLLDACFCPGLGLSYAPARRLFTRAASYGGQGGSRSQRREQQQQRPSCTLLAPAHAVQAAFKSAMLALGLRS